MSVFGMYTLTYPVVPVGPDAVKLNYLLAELKDSAVIVEFEDTVNFCSSFGS